MQPIPSQTILFSRPFDSRAKILYAFYCGLLLVQAIGVLCLLPEVLDSFFFSGLVIAVFVLGLVAAYRFGNKMVYAEHAVVDPDTFVFIERGLFQSKSAVFSRDQIKELRFLEKPLLTKHPLAGKSFDYLGFETQGKVINEMHGDHRIAFEYKGNTVTLGESLYSWHFEALSALLAAGTNAELL